MKLAELQAKGKRVKVKHKSWGTLNTHETAEFIPGEGSKFSIMYLPDGEIRTFDLDTVYEDDLWTPLNCEILKERLGIE